MFGVLLLPKGMCVNDMYNAYIAYYFVIFCSYMLSVFVWVVDLFVFVIMRVFIIVAWACLFMVYFVAVLLIANVYFACVCLGMCCCLLVFLVCVCVFNFVGGLRGGVDVCVLFG